MRRLGLFALIFIVLAALYWLLEGSALRRVPQEPGRLLSGFAPAETARLALTSPDNGAVVLQRSGAAWQVSEQDTDAAYAADSSAVQALLDSLAALTTASMVSRNPGRHALYEVDPARGVRVEARDRSGLVLADVVIGKNGPNIFSTYVRAAGSDTVYLVDGILQTAASRTLNQWRDKTVFKFDPALVHAYTVSGSCSLSLRKNADGWQAGAGPAVNGEAAARLMRAFANLSAAGFAHGPLEEFGLASPSRTVTAERAGGTSATLLLGKDANAFQQYAKTADADTVYIIEKHLLDSLCPTIEQLNAPVPDALPDAAPAAGPSEPQSRPPACPTP